MSKGKAIAYSVLRVKWSTPMSPDSFYPLYDKLFVDSEVTNILMAPKDATIMPPITECQLESYTLYEQGRWMINDMKQIQRYSQFLRDTIPYNKLATLSSCTRHDYVANPVSQSSARL